MLCCTFSRTGLGAVSEKPLRAIITDDDAFVRRLGKEALHAAGIVVSLRRVRAVRRWGWRCITGLMRC